MSSVALTVHHLAEGGEEAGGGSGNFLIPNGTFFVILAIFLIVLTVISVYVVPPITRVLRERENMVTKTMADNRQSAEQFAAAASDYEERMGAARTAATGVRDDARTAGRKVIEEARARADAEVATTLQGATEQLKQQGDAVTDELRGRVAALSATLASQILGVPVSSAGSSVTSGSTGR